MKIDTMDIIRTVLVTSMVVWWIPVMVLSDMPKMNLIPQNVTAHTGDQVSYNCFVNVTNKTLFNCQWYFRPNGETNVRQLVNGEKYNWSCEHCSEPCQYSLHITIKDVTNDDTGNYFCEAFTSVRNEAQLRVYDRHDSRQQSEEKTTGSSSSNQVVIVVSAVAAMVFIALIALIVVIIFTRRRAKPNPGKRSANGQQQPSPSKNIHSGNGNGNPEIYILQLENPNYVEVILKSNTHIDKSTNTEDIYGPQVVSRTEELNYVQLEFNSNTHDEDRRFLIHGSPSDTAYTEVVSHR